MNRQRGEVVRDDKVMSGWEVAFGDAIDLPFPAKALGADVTVFGFDSDTQHGLRCEIHLEGQGKRWVGIDALDYETVPDSVREVFDAYEAWAR